MRHVVINDMVEQKLIPSLSAGPKKPPPQAALRSAQVMANSMALRKEVQGILKKAPEVKKEVVEDEDSSSKGPCGYTSASDFSEVTPPSSPGPVLLSQAVYNNPPSSPEGPSLYRGKPVELTKRRY